MNEKRQLIDVNNEITEVLELTDKDFKTSIIKMLQWAIVNTLERNKILESLSQKKKEDKNQIESLELNNTVKKILKL